jgi:hypothetical protein
MRSKSFLRFLGKQEEGVPVSKRRRRASSRELDRSRYSLPRIERLESRELLSNDAPTILRVTPADGSTSLTALPTLAITFSEDVNAAQAQNPSNYILFNATGKSIPIDSATYDSTRHQVFLGYNAGTPLTADRYTLFVRGNEIHDTDENLPMAQAQQFVVANGGTNTISTITLPGDNTLQAISNYSGGGAAPTPSAVAFADLAGRNIADLVVVNSGNTGQGPATAASVTIFQGLGGNRFTTTPSATLPLPGGAKPLALVVADLHGGGKPDIAVANSGTDSVTVFLNNGQGVFGPGTTYAAGKNPVAIVAADFDGSGRRSLAVAGLLADPITGAYNVTVLPADPRNAGQFLTAIPFNTGMTLLTSLAVGPLRSGKQDLVVGATNGIRILFNNTQTQGNIDFVQGQIISQTPVSAVAVGNVGPAQLQDIVATTKTNNGQVLIFPNAGGGFFGSPTIYSVGANPTAVTLADLNGDGKNDILITNGITPATQTSSVVPGKLTVLLNQSGSTISFANAVAYEVDGNPAAVAVHLTGSIADAVATANMEGNDASVLRVRANGTLVVSSDTPLGVAGATPSAVAIGDLNGTFLPSIVIASFPLLSSITPDTVTVLIAQADGTYAAPVTYNVGFGLGTFGPSLSLALADLTGTGKKDIIVTNTSTAGGLLGANISILANSGTGVFTVLPPIAVSTGFAAPTGIAVADFNNDGKLDLAVSLGFSGVAVLLGNGDRTFRPPRLFGTGMGVNAVALAAADFSKSGNMDLAVADGRPAGNVLLLKGDGTGNFASPGLIAAGENPTSIAVGDLNRDGYPDIVVTNQSLPGQAINRLYVSVLLNNQGGGFRSAIETTVQTNATGQLQSVSIADIDRDLFPDLILGVTGAINSVVTLKGVGDGSFQDVRFYAGEGGGTRLRPVSVGLTSDNFIRATTFTVASNVVRANLVENGAFQTLDLNNERGNLNGWQTFAQTNSRGQWLPQTGATAPLSFVPIAPPPLGAYAAVLDEPDLVVPQRNLLKFSLAYIIYPFATTQDYDGTHILYQDIRIPATATRVTLSFSLYVNNSDPLNSFGFSDTTLTSALDYFPDQPIRPANQQVRVDIMDPNADIRDVGAGVLRNAFITRQGPPRTLPYTTYTTDVTAFRGRTVRFRVAEVNNQGRMIVGIDDVQLQAVYTDTQPPTINGLRLRNPGFGATPSFAGNTTDPTIAGQVSDDGSPSNVAYVAFDLSNTGNFNGPNAFRITTWDALGNFQAALPVTLPGPYTVAVKIADKAGNASTYTITFNFQGPSLSSWQASGPGPERFVGEGTNYHTVSGKITSIALDPRDKSGNTFYIGADNGGIWKTLDGGNNWTPLTDSITDPILGNIPEPIGSLAVVPDDPDTVFAATGVADNATTSRPGFGILKSGDAGRTWNLIGTDVFRNALISKIAVAKRSNDGITRIYVAVAKNGRNGPGVYRSTDGGNTWVFVTDPTKMFRDDGTPLATGTALASVTDLQIDHLSFNEENLWMGLGNIGMVANNNTAGVWKSPNFGDTWIEIIGGHDPGNPFKVWSPQNNNGPTGIDSTKLPSAPNFPNAGAIAIGRVTIGLASSRVADEQVVYVFMGRPPSSQGSYGDIQQSSEVSTALGESFGLFKTKNGGLSWTHVMLRENVPIPNKPRNWLNLFTMGHEAAQVGALAVDPQNANIVYVGGSDRYLRTQLEGTLHEGARSHGFLRVDTTNMRDVDYVSPFYDGPLNKYPNDGDDIIKAADAAMQGTPPREKGSYPQSCGGGGYEGEGVFWYDLQTTDRGQQNISLFTLAATYNLPATIHALVFDPQGRLLVGTEGGLWRGVSQGFVYDTTGGGTDFAAEGSEETCAGTVTPNEPGMVFTDLNGNLQIADVTSVAIDSNNRHTLHTSTANLGWQQTTGQLPNSLQWTSANNFVTPSGVVFFGLAGAFSDGFAIEGPHAGMVRAGRRDPTAAPNAPSIVYRTFANGIRGDPGIIGVGKSIQSGAGGTFVTANQGMDLGGVPGDLFPPLAINQTKLQDVNGAFFDELMYGTNKIFETDNNAANWDQVIPPLSGDVFTALGFGPSASDVFYAGTALGQVFVDLRDGGDGFPNRSTGLPGSATNARINGITVDPRDPKTAYVMTGGTQPDHVFKTTDAGVTWTDISATLPQVPAYAMAIDPRSSPGSPSGKLFLGTDVGVYISTDNGASWRRFGVGMPNVPAVDLQFDSVWESLAVATEGRGTFQISTSLQGPHVVSVDPATPVAPGLSAVMVRFSQPMDPRTFTTDSIRILSGPGGPITPRSVVDQDPFGDHMSFQINFFPQSSDGVYNLTLAPTIRDLVGNPMDQDGNGINGEDPGDAFSVRFVVNSTDNGRFVTGIYHDLVGRPADTEGFVFFLGPVDAARFQALPAISQGIVSSEEARRDAIFNPANNTGAYPRLLHRAAAPGEVEFWFQIRRFGATPEDVFAQIAGSDEYYQQAAVGGTDRAFVNQLYVDFLGRSADDFGLNIFLQNQAAAEDRSRQTTASVLDHSGEYIGNLVAAQYATYLGRPASGGEIANWVNQFRGGVTDETFNSILLGSDEYFARRGGSNASWLNGVFADVLNRAPDPSTQAFFLGELQAGQSRASVALQILTSSEYRRGLIQSYFTKYLGRSAAEADIAAFTAALAGGVTDEGVISIIVGSREYFQNHQGSATTQQAANLNWLSAAYQDLLGRPVDDSGRANFLQGLAQDERLNRTRIVQAITGSDEYRAFLITTTYQTYLNRPAGVAEISIWQPLLKQPSAGPGTASPDEQFLSAVLGSGEYFTLQRGTDNVATNANYVSSLYQKLLSRSPDAAGFGAHLNALQTAYQSQRLADATAMDSSAEYRQKLVGSFFRTYLRRAPSPTELAARVTDLANGVTDEQLINILISSAEYFQNPNLGGNDNSKWLNQVFRDLLGRDRDASAQPLLDALNNNTLTRSQVVNQIINSDEYERRLVTQFYTTYLGRTPVTGEQNIWLSVIRSGVTDERIIAEIIASNEYAQRTHPFP